MEVLVRAASLLIRHGSSDPWDELQELFLQRPEIGTIVAGEMQDDSANTEFLSRMSDSSLGGVLCLASQKRCRRGCGATPRRNSRRTQPSFKNACGQNLHCDGRAGECVSVFEYVKHAFPEDSWMRFHQERVTQVALRKAWEPLSSETLLKMERDHGLPWHQKEAAVVGPFLLSLIFGVMVTEAFNSGGPRWISALAGILVGLTIGIASCVFRRSRRSLLTSARMRRFK
jgi:hypothetical protein